MSRTRLWFWFCCYNLCLKIASYQFFLALVRRTSFMLATVSPGFLRAGRSIVNFDNFANFAHWVTYGHGCPAVPVSCSGGTAGIINNYVFCLW
jgi:hypothetical protein